LSQILKSRTSFVKTPCSSPKSRCRPFILSGLVFLSLTPVWSQELPEPPSIQVPDLSSDPAISANADDAAWKQAAKIGPLTPALGQTPLAGQMPPTYVLLGWSPKALYIRFLCQGKDIYNPIPGAVADAPYYRGDAVEVFLDPKGDSREWIEIVVSPDNGVLRALHVCLTDPVSDSQGALLPAILNRDVLAVQGWKGLPNLKTAAGHWTGANGESGWLVDIAIPPEALHRLGLAHYEPVALRANFIRTEYPSIDGDPQHKTFVPQNWSPTAYGRPQQSPQRMGYLHLQP
jgi:hypothetical protein